MTHNLAMSGRISGAAALLATVALLGGCGSADAPAANSRPVACGPVGADVAQICVLEVTDKGGNLTLVLRQPEGGFHRLTWPKGGMLEAADGAEKLVTVPLPGGGVEVRIDRWAYRIERKGGGLP